MSQLVSDTPTVDEALALLHDAYRTRLRRSGRTIEHPLLVGMLLAAQSHPPPVVAAGLLHDVLEDTTLTPAELRAAAGAEIAGTVTALTQDASITPYRARKAALRRQILDAGPPVAMIALADKLAKLRACADRPAKRKLAHYRAMLDGVEDRYGPCPLTALLRDELARWPNTRR